MVHQFFYFEKETSIFITLTLRGSGRLWSLRFPFLRTFQNCQKTTNAICINLSDFSFNTRVYNLISVPHITQLISEDAIISSKKDPRIGSKKEKKS